jgi:hypothetical protein
MTRSQRNAGLMLSPILAMAWSGDALAYRPFDGTDAAIAEPCGCSKLRNAEKA